MIRGRTRTDGAVEFYEDTTSVVAFTITAAGATGVTADWNTLANKPASFAPTIGATATTAVAGNDTRLAAGAAGTATVRALAGGTAATASASDHTHTGLLTGSATAVNNSAAADVATLVTNYNALLAALRARGIITGS